MLYFCNVNYDSCRLVNIIGYDYVSSMCSAPDNMRICVKYACKKPQILIDRKILGVISPIKLLKKKTEKKMKRMFYFAREQNYVT